MRSETRHFGSRAHTTIPNCLSFIMVLSWSPCLILWQALQNENQVYLHRSPWSFENLHLKNLSYIKSIAQSHLIVHLCIYQLILTILWSSILYSEICTFQARSLVWRVEEKPVKFQHYMHHVNQLTNIDFLYSI